MYISKSQKQVLLLYGSTLIGLVLGVFSSVINTHYLLPEFYGDVRYVQNIISFVSSLLLFGYFTSGSRLLAISNDETYNRCVRGVMCVILILAILVVMLVIGLFYISNKLYSNNHMANLFLASIPFCGNVLMLSYINTTAQGDNHIGRIALARILPPFFYCIIAYWIFSTYGASPTKMLLLYNGTIVIILSCIIWSTMPSFNSLKATFKILNKENRKYGINIYIGSLVGVSTSYISGITLGLFCDTNLEVGFYTLATTISTPLMMLPNIIGTTYFKSFAVLNVIEKRVLLGSIFLTLLSLIVYIMLIKYIVALLYNDSYFSVSIYASWLAIGMCVHGLGDMFNRFLGAHGQGLQIRNAAFSCGIITLIGSILFVYLFGIRGAILTSILSSTIYLLVLVYYYIHFVKSTI